MWQMRATAGRPYEPWQVIIAVADWMPAQADIVATRRAGKNGILNALARTEQNHTSAAASRILINTPA